MRGRIPDHRGLPDYDRRNVHAGGDARARAVLHQHRSPGLRADQSARNRQGRALRALLAIGEVGPTPVPRRVPRRDVGATAAAPGAAVDQRGRHRARRQAVRARAQRVRRRLGRAARRRPHRLRRRVERPDQSARVGTPDGVSRAVDALRAVHRSPGRPLEVSRPRGARRLAAARRRSSARSTSPSTPTRAGSRRWKRTSAPGIRSRRRIPTPSTSRSIRAKALDTLRGLLPAATTSNVGLFGTGQAFEALLLRMFAHPLEEVRGCAQQMLAELRQVIPAFLARLDQPNRGGRWIEYFADDAARVRGGRRAVRRAGVSAEPRGEVTLTDFDPDGEIEGRRRGALSASALPDDQLLAIARRMSADDRAALLPRLRRQARQPPPQAGPRVRAHQLPLRRPRRLRRLPRSAAPPPADARMAAAQRAPRLHRAGGDRGGGRARRLARRHGAVGRRSTNS